MTKALSELNDHLYAQIDRLMSSTLTPEQTATEVTRTHSLVQIADRVTNIADLQLQSAKLYAAHGNGILNQLPQIAAPKE